MIYGFFGSDGHAYLRGYVYLPRFGVSRRVDFLVDTGADVTTLHPDDGLRFNFPFDELENPVSVGGIGGEHIYYDEPADIYFRGTDRLYGFRTNLSVGKPSEETDDLESLLGLDILNRMRMDYDFRRKRLRLYEVSPDWQQVLPEGRR